MNYKYGRSAGATVSAARSASSQVRRRINGAAVVASCLLVAVTVVATASSASAGLRSASHQSGVSEHARTDKKPARFWDLLPASIQKAGVITDASAFDYPPYAYTSASGAYTGGEIAILNDVAPLLGIKFTYERLTEFSALVPAVGDGRVEMASESVGVTAPRRKVVSYVEYGITGEGLLVKKGNPSGISVDNICGHSVSVEAGAVEVSFFGDISTQCTKHGKKPVDVEVYSTEPAQVLAVEDGHADAVGVGSTTTISIATESKGALTALPGLIPGGSLGLGFIFNPKEGQLAKAFQSAMFYLHTNGELAQINKKWDLVTTLHVQYLPAT
jgi:polar amino acid transport system substrate-binding protein